MISVVLRHDVHSFFQRRRHVRSKTQKVSRWSCHRFHHQSLLYPWTNCWNIRELKMIIMGYSGYMGGHTGIYPMRVCVRIGIPTWSVVSHEFLQLKPNIKNEVVWGQRLWLVSPTPRVESDDMPRQRFNTSKSKNRDVNPQHVAQWKICHFGLSDTNTLQNNSPENIPALVATFRSSNTAMKTPPFIHCFTIKTSI